MRLTRRSFTIGVAAVCAGCGSSDSSDSGSASSVPVLDDPGLFTEVTPVGTIDEVMARIEEGDGRTYEPTARAWLVAYPAEGIEQARSHYDARTMRGIERGLLALYQKCPHLGCRVPECASSGQFECPCHGSAFNRVGEYVSGPSPRGMDRFALLFDGDRVAIDTSSTIEGLGRDIQTIDSEPEGPRCIG